MGPFGTTLPSAPPLTPGRSRHSPGWVPSGRGLIAGLRTLRALAHACPAVYCDVSLVSRRPWPRICWAFLSAALCSTRGTRLTWTAVARDLCSSCFPCARFDRFEPRLPSFQHGGGGWCGEGPARSFVVVFSSAVPVSAGLGLFSLGHTSTSVSRLDAFGPLAACALSAGISFS